MNKKKIQKKPQSDEKNKNKNNEKISKNMVFILVGLGVILLVLGIVLVRNQESKTIEGNVIATVNGEEITENMVTEIQESRMISFEDALEQLINTELLLQEAKKQGYEITKQEVEQELESNLILYGMTLEEFKKQIESEGISYEEYLEESIPMFVIGNYLESLMPQDLESEISDEEIKEYYDQLKKEYEMYGEEIPDFEEISEEIKEHLIYERQVDIQEGIIADLKEKAEIVYLQDIEEEFSEEDFVDIIEDEDLEVEIMPAE